MYPVYCFLVCLLVAHALMVVLTAALVVAGVNVLPLVFDRLPLDILDNKHFLRGLAWDYRNEENDVIFEVCDCLMCLYYMYMYEALHKLDFAHTVLFNTVHT